MDGEADSTLPELKGILYPAPSSQHLRPELLYLAATNSVISILILVEHKEEAHEYRVYRPVYYVSKVLPEPKKSYPHYPRSATPH
jgi:hypothetical protein